MRHSYKNLVFEGGGVKGIAYIGAMRELNSRGFLDRVNRVAGTSAGAINAVLVALGFSIAEQEKILRSLDFSSFQDTKVFKGLDKSLFKRVLKKDKESLLKLVGAAAFLWFRKGLHSGKSFEDWLRNTVEQKTGDGGITFRKAYELTGCELSIFASNLSTKQVNVLNCETTPNLEIVKAVRASMSIPLFFEPVEIELKGSKQLFVDGGLFRNYPIRFYDKGHTPNFETLGFRLESRESIEVFSGISEPTPDIVTSPYDFYSSLIQSILLVQENQFLNSPDAMRTVFIDTLDVGVVDFDLDSHKVDSLVKSGTECTRHFFDTRDSSKSGGKANVSIGLEF